MVASHNRLANSSSLYLRQHAENPIDWWPWGPEAFEVAKRLNRPVFLSIGYSSCHWCHVMAHESFENTVIAAKVNELFVAIKVDREERPDVDRLYMDTVVAMTGRGGWPMSVFLDPDGVPIFAGTYFPPEDRYGMPGFVTVLESIARAFHQTPEKIGQNRTRFFDVFSTAPSPAAIQTTTAQNIQALTNRFREQKLAQYDSQFGGYGGAPKFPPSGAFETLYRVGRSDAALLASVRHTLRAICDGGIRDQVRGGFHRYSTDAHWLVPHFEKMLYDQNALLEALLYESLSPDGQWAVLEAEATRAFLQQDMKSGQGFAGALDADDPEGEGFYYTFTFDELRAAEVGEGLHVPEHANFEHRVILSRDGTLARIDWYRHPGIHRAREKLVAVQARRQPPVCDPKILVEWNAYLAQQGYRWFARTGDTQWLTLATNLHNLLSQACTVRQGHWLVPRMPGVLSDVRFLEDAVALAACKVAKASVGDLAALIEAQQILHSALHDFVEVGHVYAATVDPLLPVRRPAPLHDAPTPPAAIVLARLCNLIGTLLEDAELLQAAAAIGPALRTALEQYPMASGGALEALREIVHGPEILMVLLPADSPLQVDPAALRPGVWTFYVRADQCTMLPYTRTAPKSNATCYLFCSNHTCSLPSATPFK